jgi:hypothetical protein
MPDDVAEQHRLTEALKRETLLLEGAKRRWREAIAAAHAAGVSRDSILKAAGPSDALEVQDFLLELERMADEFQS